MISKLAMVTLGLTIFVGYSFASMIFPPALLEFVNHAEYIGIVTIRSAEVYEVRDEIGNISCGVIYRSHVEEAFEGKGKSWDFSSREVLSVNSKYLVYIAAQPMFYENTGEVVLTETGYRALSERQARIQKERLQLCEHTKNLPKLIPFATSEFEDRRQIAESLRGDVWLEWNLGYEKEIPQIAVVATEISIDTVKYPLAQLLDRFDNGRNLIVRRSGLLGARSFVDWPVYRTRLIELLEQKHNKKIQPDATELRR